MTASVLGQLNAALLGDAGFTKLRAQAQAVEANNGIYRAEERIRDLRDQLLLLESCVTDLEMVEELCERCLLMNGGKIVFLGDTKSALDMYKRMRGK